MDQRILQWNSRSILLHKPDLINLINDYNPIVVALSETWLLPDSRFRVSGYSCLRDDNDNGYGGSALLIRRSLSFSQIPLPTHNFDFNVVAVRVLNITIISLYIPHPHISLISPLFNILYILPQPIIILGDFNAHHTSWGSHHSDSFAMALIDMFDNINVCILNDGSPTRRVYPSQNPKSAVDLSLCSPSLSSLLAWSVLPLSHGSDHFPIIISLPNRSSVSIDSCPLFKYKVSKAEFPNFISSVDIKVNDLSLTSLDNCLDNYSKFIEAFTSSVSARKSRHKTKVSLPWWDPDCSLVIKERNDAEKVYSLYMTIDNFINYKNKAAQAKRLLKKKKKLGWKKYCENISPRCPSTFVWRSIRRFRGSLNIENITSNDDSIWIDSFSDRLAPPFVPSLDAIPSSPYFIPSSCRMDMPFSFEELECSLSGLKDTSPGIDGIPYSFISQATTNIKKYYLNLINAFFDLGVVPETWRNQIVLPILKPGKNPIDPNSRRPIALSSVLLKIMEHLIKNRIEWVLENNKLLARTQYGFRKGMSTIDNLSILVTDIHIAFKEKGYLVGAFLDISSAYDNVLLPILRRKMQQLNIPEKIVRMVCNLLMERSIFIKSQGNLCPPRKVWKGLPQGSVLSPLLYNLYTYDLERSVFPTCNILQYADDIALYVAVQNISDASSRLNCALRYLCDWLLDNGLCLSAAKSSAVVFTKKRNNVNLDIFVGEDLISVQNNIKFLGVILDSKLTGIPHLNYVSEKCEKGVNVLRSLSGVWWGSHPYSQKLIYNAIVRSHFDYGCFLLDPCNKSALEKLNKVQAKCLRVILGAMRSSPKNALQVECVDPPLHLRRQYICDRYFFKIVQFPHHPLMTNLPILYQLVCASSGFNSLYDLPCLLRSYIYFFRLSSPVVKHDINPMFSIPYDALIYKPNIIMNFGIEKSSLYANKIFCDLVSKNWSNWLTAFTDASKLSPDGEVGIAVWFPKYKIILSFKSPPISSVFTGEAIAILEAILYVMSHNLNKVIIFSDSLSSLFAITSNPFRSKSKFPVILKIKEALYNCYLKGLEIAIAWIPSHSGISGNESADSHAKNAVELGTLNRYSYYSHDLCSLAKLRLEKSWKKEWDISIISKAKHYASIQLEIPSKPWFFKQKHLSKMITSTICRLRLGHACTPVFLAKIRIRDSSICECGLDEGSSDHIFFSCSNLKFSLYDFLPPDIPRPTNLSLLLSYVNTPFVNIIARFIISNNIKL